MQKCTVHKENKKSFFHDNEAQMLLFSTVRVLNWLMSHPCFSASSSCPTSMPAFLVIGSVTWPVPVATAQSEWRSWCWRRRRCTAVPRGSVATRATSGVSVATYARQQHHTLTHHSPERPLKGTVHPFSHPHVVPNLYEPLSSVEHKKILWRMLGTQQLTVATDFHSIFFPFKESKWLPSTEKKKFWQMWATK